MLESFLGAFLVAAILCALCCGMALALFPWFRSGERKEGNFKADQSTGGFRFDPKKKELKKQPFRVSASELPLVGGPSLLFATVAASLGFAFWLGLDTPEWLLLGLVLLGILGYGAIGFIDDWQKVHRGVGITEIQKFIGVLIVSLGIGVAFNRLIVTKYLSARLPYPPYSDIPLLGQVLIHAHFAWIIFFIGMTVLVGVTTPLAVDFADGMDGLCGGLMVSASLAFAVILLFQDQKDLWPLIVVSLAVAGASLGYLPFNWPSGWRNHVPGRKRRARLIMGDTGSLGLGGALALVAIISRLEVLLIIIGGVFVLEGLSALVSARILVKFFRRFLFLERFGDTKGFPHTEFPLPFLATPMHHHYDLLNWNRERLVYMAWLLGAVLGLLGVASVIAPLTWERYLARLVGLLALVAVWQLGPQTKRFFLGLALKRSDQPNSPRRLGLFYGYPYKLFGRRLYHCVDLTSVRETELASPIEDFSLWQRISVFDARSLLGYYCYRAGALEDALRVWDRLPRPNLLVRPEIDELIGEVRHQLAMRDAERELAGYANGASAARAGDDPGSTGAWRMTAPPDATQQPPRMRSTGASGSMPPAQIDLADRPPATSAGPAPLWNPSKWAAAMAPVDGSTSGITGPAGPSANSPANSSARRGASRNDAGVVPVTTNLPRPASQAPQGDESDGGAPPNR
jgi:UDP-N-acetylmuramyl pentapeptide phosphotransferase/UDP-N-acetylglucosamine-1-phosphate transferase